MADNKDELNLDDTESTGVEAGTKKSAGFSAMLPTILKFVAIGVGALIFIVTVTVITYRIMSGSGRPQTAQPETNPYIGKRPELSWFTSIGVIRTRTKDPTPYTVVVNMIIGYDLNDKNAQTELTNRLYELKDFVRNYFSNKYAAELRPENEEQLKIEIRQKLNDTILQKTRVREILFQQLDVMEM